VNNDLIAGEIKATNENIADNFFKVKLKLAAAEKSY